jgi:aminoglycoside phosphotransferase (APT) family kinase protein
MTGAKRRLGPRGAPAATAPGWVAAASGGSALTARPLPWGFRHETWVVETIDGRALVVQRRVDGSDPTDPRLRAVRGAVRVAGLPVPEPARVALEGADVVVALPFVEGLVAAELLGSDGDPELVGRLCGEVAARLGTVSPAGLPLSRIWASANDLRAAARRWMESLPDAVPARTRERLLVDVDRVALEVETAPPRFAHGDVAPVNLLVRDGRVAAVLDLDRARLALPLYDAAWFAWVVSFHHPDVAEAAWSAYSQAAGLAIRSAEDVAWLWPLQLLERLAEAPDAAERRAWADRLAATLDHVGGNGGNDDAP